MAERTYPSGVPCWIDTEPTDADAAKQFYGGLFGWTFTNAMPPDAPGYYFIAQLDGEDVGAIASPEPVSTGAWNTYIAVDDTDADVGEAQAAGATVTSPPQDAGPPTNRAGRWAEVVDPTGRAFVSGRPARRLGAQVVNAPGLVELQRPAHGRSRSRPGVLRAAVRLGGRRDRGRCGDVASTRLRPAPRRDGRSEDHRTAARGVGATGFEDAIALLAPLADGEEPHWHVTFAVADRDDAVATASRAWRDGGLGSARQRVDQVGGGTRTAGGDLHPQPVRPDGLATDPVGEMRNARGRVHAEPAHGFTFP